MAWSERRWGVGGWLVLIVGLGEGQGRLVGRCGRGWEKERGDLVGGGDEPVDGGGGAIGGGQCGGR